MSVDDIRPTQKPRRETQAPERLEVSRNSPPKGPSDLDPSERKTNPSAGRFRGGPKGAYPAGRTVTDPTLLVLSLGIGLFCCPGKRAELSDQLDHENAELKGLGAFPVIGSGDLGAANPSISIEVSDATESSKDRGISSFRMQS